MSYALRFTLVRVARIMRGAAQVTSGVRNGVVR